MTKAQERLWLQGFAIATATIYRCHHDWQMVCSVMAENGVTIDELRAAGCEEIDLKQIVEAAREGGDRGKRLYAKKARAKKVRA